MARIPTVAGNWKMNLDHLEANQLAQKPARFLGDPDHGYGEMEVAVAPPLADLRMVQVVVNSEGLKIKYGAQDISTHGNGAYTGEISMGMLAKSGYIYVVAGHPECREYHGESSELISAKVKKVLEADLTPIVCCGEALETRKEGRQIEYVVGQIDAMLAHLSGEDVVLSVTAHELIWAIGMGEVAVPEDVQEVCGATCRRVAELYDGSVADAVRVQYGRSVKSSNIIGIMAQPDVDGAPIGGVSLKAYLLYVSPSPRDYLSPIC